MNLLATQWIVSSIRTQAGATPTQVQPNQTKHIAETDTAQLGSSPKCPTNWALRWTGRETSMYKKDHFGSFKYKFLANK